MVSFFSDSNITRKNEESDMISQMMRKANASWDNPQNFNEISQSTINKFTRSCDSRLKGIWRYKYLGIGKTKKYKHITNLDIPWGWKDPRNTFTLKIWLQLFPSAKIIHIYRNPIDVSISLYKRELKRRKMFILKLRKFLREDILRNYWGHVYSHRSLSKHEGIQIWKEYIEKAFEYKHKYPVFDICYENFLQHPDDIIYQLNEFIGLNSEINLSEITKSIDASRKYCFFNDPESIELYNLFKNDSLFKKLNYNNLI